MSDANEAPEILFTKAANTEQLQIARNLEKYDCVLVQGPPGTGKTHTIANLLGHLLSLGKSVLVTSHRTKALRVLRDMVVPTLQPLCLSVLDEDVQDAERLKSSVDGIVERLGTSNEAQLTREIDELTENREATLAEIRQLRTDVREARLNEERYILIGGEGERPIEAAKFVASGAEKYGWIPGPVTLGEPLPLSEDEIAALYRTNATVSLDDQQSLGLWLPEVEDLMQPDRFAALVEERQSLEMEDRDFGREFWRSDNLSIESLEELYSGTLATLAIIEKLPKWTNALANAGIASGDEDLPWERLIQDIKDLYSDCVAAQDAVIRYDPQLPQDKDPEVLVSIFGQLSAEVKHKGKLSRFSLLLKKDWRLAIDATSINAKRPYLLEHFEVLTAYAKMCAKRSVLRDRWDRQVVSLGGPDSASFGMIEQSVRVIPVMNEALKWSTEAWAPQEDRLENAGLDLGAIKSRAASRHYEVDHLGRMLHVLKDFVLPTLVAKGKQLRWDRIDYELQEIRSRLHAPSRPAAQVVTLRAAAERLHVTQYRDAFEELLRLRAVETQAKRRGELLDRLSGNAPNWAMSIRTREGLHGEKQVPGEAALAWKWRQYHDELSKRDRTSLSELMRRLDSRRTELREVTAAVVDRMAWHSQHGRTGLKERQALQGWYQANKKIGKGTGKRVPTLRRLARSLMADAQSAVPVWVMPMVKVAESYDPQKSKFDVVIIDEASQSDLTGLFAFYLGKQIIIVGDDEQVSPDAVGEKVEETQHLIDEYLQGIPNADLYDGRQSIYDIAKQAFGGTICLLEHFRCVPDIIRFSNALSYNGRIKPLREASSTCLVPSTIAYRVASAGVDYKNVNAEEARAVAALVCAAVEQPEYADKSFGVISMVGEEQARRIEELIRSHLSPVEIENRRLLAGNSAQFQGDERDVVFISMVDVGEGVPLRMRQEPLFKKRFNVAASRARDQMWVVHSLDPDIDLKQDDLRRVLIQHALNPNSTPLQEQTEGQRTESPFELEVFKRLVAAGYNVRCNVPVGAYRIDMVITGASNRLALECDGDQFHRLEDLDRDLARQAVLERLGWRFVRIRGSEFYRDREKALKPLFDRLDALDILPFVTRASDAEPSGSGIIERVRARAAEFISDPEFARSLDASEKRWRRGFRRSTSSESSSASSHRENGEAAVSPRADAPEEHGNGRLVKRLRARALEVIDARPDGPLWVVGGRRLQSLLEDLKSDGVRFIYAEDGSEATGYQPAWFTGSDK